LMMLGWFSVLSTRISVARWFFARSERRTLFIRFTATCSAREQYSKAR
jgi:hypothetical protein